MSKKRFDNLDARRQDRLFNSAAEEFAAHGYDGASLNRILKRSGMSKSSLYYYFEDKADLFISLVERSLAYLLRELGGLEPAAMTAQGYWDDIDRYMRRALQVLNRNAWYVKLGRMVIRLRSQPRGLQRTSRLYGAMERYTGLLLSRGQELGVVRDDLPASYLIHATMGLGEALDTWLLDNWDCMTEDARLDMVSTNVALVRRLLEPPELRGDADAPPASPDRSAARSHDSEQVRD